MTTPHTSGSEGSSGDSVAAPTISDERLAVLIDTYISTYDEAHIGPVILREINSALRELQRLRSASAAPVEGVREPDGYAYRYPDPFGRADSVIVFDGGGDRNGSKPIEAVPYWLGKAPAAPPSREAKPVEAPTGEKVWSEAKACIRPTHEAADAFWKYWRENGETHKHGYYESTWGAINAALNSTGQIDALRTDTAPGLPAQAAKPPTCGVTEDAARYRWLKEQRRWLYNLPPTPGISARWENYIAGPAYWLDAAIDAARLSKGERGRGEAPLSRGDPA